GGRRDLFARRIDGESGGTSFRWLFRIRPVSRRIYLYGLGTHTGRGSRERIYLDVPAEPAGCLPPIVPAGATYTDAHQHFTSRPAGIDRSHTGDDNGSRGGGPDDRWQ